MSASSQRSRRWFGVPFILCGVISLYLGGLEVVRGYSTHHWTRTDGVITSAKVEARSDNDGGTTHAASVAYDYKVGGVSYTGTRVCFGDYTSSAARAQAIVNRYPPGTTVPVFYSPRDSESVVLERGVFGGIWIWFGVGALLLAVGVGLVLKRTAQVTADESAGQQPPRWMGVLFILVGGVLPFLEPNPGIAGWILPAAGAFFVLSGLFILALRLENKCYSKVLLYAAAISFIAILHWISFGPGERIGTVQGPFSGTSGADVRPYFVAFTLLIDFVLAAGTFRWLMKKLGAD